MFVACKSRAKPTQTKVKFRRKRVHLRKSQPKDHKTKSIFHLPESTYDFRKADSNALEVKYKGCSSPKDIASRSFDHVSVPKEVYVANLSASEIASLARDKSEFDKLGGELKTFVHLINYVLENDNFKDTRESRTDAFVYHLLDTLGFGAYPLTLAPRPVFWFRIDTEDIFSEPDIAVQQQRRILLVAEEKNLRKPGIKTAWGEYQLAGELIASAYTDYIYPSKGCYNEILYAIRILELKFTFYKATITALYLDALDAGFPDLSVEIMRYPQESKSKGFPYLDYADSRERSEIIDMLLSMREELKEST